MTDRARELEGTVVLVTGAGRGAGRGIATGLAHAGATVYATGRTIAEAVLPPTVRRLPCDHTDDTRTAAVFSRIAEEAGRLDVLVNSAWGGYEQMVEGGSFTWTLPFWKQPLTRDAAHELRPHGVAVVSLYPGLVRTEAVLAAGAFDLSNSESPEFIGRAVAALARDPNILERSGTVLVAAAVAQGAGIVDVDGRSPRPLSLADFAG